MFCPGGLTATPVIGPADAAGKYIVYVISWDGRLRKMDVATGNEIEPAEPFLPPNGKPYALNLRDNVLYTTTAQGCGGNPNAFYSYDLATKKSASTCLAAAACGRARARSSARTARVYAGSGDGDYYPERQIYGQSIIGVKQDPETKAMSPEGLVRADQRLLAAQARSRHDVTGPIFDCKGKESPGPVEQGVPVVAARYRRARRRGPPHAGLPNAAHLQRGRQLRRAGTWGALAIWEDKDGTR